MRNSMPKNKGFTLIEIIVSLAIFAIISVGFLGMFTTVFINTYKTSKITENSFASQSVVEDKILEVKNKIDNDAQNTIDITPTTVTIFDELGVNFKKVITVYHIKEGVSGGRPIETYVTQTRAPKLIVPKITSTVTITANTLAVEPYPNLGMKSNLTLNAATPVVDKPGYLIQHLYYWYRSNQTQYVKSLVPEFPAEYEIIPAYTGKVISTITDDYANRFVQLMITPVGEKGQMGSGYPSNNVLISGLSVNNDLLIHLDASMIDLSKDVTAGRVVRWKDIGPKALSVSDSNSANRPQIDEHIVYDSVPHKVLGVSRNSTGSTQQLTIQSNNTINTGKTNVTAYVAIKFASVNAVTVNVPIIDSNSSGTTNEWSLGTNATGQLQLNKQGTNNNTSQNRYIALSETNFKNDAWSILRLDIYTNVIRIYNGLTLVGETYNFTETKENSTSLSSNFNLTPFQVIFNNVGYSVGEVLVYEGQQSTADSQKVLDYLYKKFIGE